MAKNRGSKGGGPAGMTVHGIRGPGGLVTIHELKGMGSSNPQLAMMPALKAPLQS